MAGQAFGASAPSEAWDEDGTDARAGRGRTAVLERPGETPPETELGPWLLGEHVEHSKEVVVCFAGRSSLDEDTESLLGGVVIDFLEEAPRRGYRSLVLACHEEAPFRPRIERAVEDAAQSDETLTVRFSAQPRRVDLAVVFDRAVGWERGGLHGVVASLEAQGAAAALAVAANTDAGELFSDTLSSLLESGRCMTYAEFIDNPPAPGTDLRISARMLEILSRTAPR